jgi:DNA-binding transcriptional ArsR family regulator
MLSLHVRPLEPPDIWHALADPTRRRLIDELAEGQKTTRDLCERFPMGRYGVMKHLAILEQAGLVTARKHGRLRMNHLNRKPLVDLQRRWLTKRALATGALANSLTRWGEGHTMKNANSPAPGLVEIAMDWTIAASVHKVWSGFVDHVDDWWPTSHRAGPPEAVMKLDARVGGALTEMNRTGAGLEWYRVTAMLPQASIDLTGHLASRYGGPATSFLHIEFAAGPKEGTCTVRLTDSLVGRVSADTHESVSTGWGAIVGGLVTLLESKR